MKTLILFLCVFALSAEAQELLRMGGSRYTLKIDSSGYAPREIYRITDSTLAKSYWMEHPATQSIVALVSLWREYKAECAKSIKVATSWKIDTARMRREPPKGIWVWTKVDSVLRTRNPYPSAEEFLDVWLPKKLK